MTRITTDSGLLSLTGLLLERDDPCLRAGAHLRWWMSPELGLPRAGFRVRRRPAPSWPWPKSETVDAHFSRHSIATSAAGVHVTYRPLRVEQAVVAPDFTLRCERRRPMRFLYEKRDQDEPQFQPFVRFAVVLRCPSPSSIIVLRAFMKRNGADEKISEQRVRFRDLSHYSRPGQPERVIFVSASEIHRVELVAPDNAAVQAVHFATPTLLHEQRDWEEIGIFTPLCAPGTPNAAAPDNVRTLAARRLVANRPRRRPGDPSTAGAGKLWTATDHRQFERALMEDAVPLSESISRAFRLEQDSLMPPGLITLADVDEERIVSDEGVSDGSIDLPFYGVLQAGAFSPHVAAMLGLAHHDKEVEASRSYDYAVDALTPSVWLLRGLLTPEVAEKTKIKPIPKLDFGTSSGWGDEADKSKGRRRVIRERIASPALGTVRGPLPPKILDRIKLPPFAGPFNRPPVIPMPMPEPVPSRLSGLWDVEPDGYHRLVAFLLDQTPAVHDVPAAPHADGRSLPDAGAAPVQVRVALKARPGTFGSRSLMWRKRDTQHTAIGPIDPATGLMIPALPAEDGFCRFMDEDVSTFGQARYRAIDVDTFGRASRPFDARVEIRDLVAPPSPSRPEITAGNPSTPNGTHFPAAELRTTWRTGMAEATPDLAAIRFLWRKGHHSAAGMAASHEGETRVVWPSPTAISHQGGTDVIAEVALDLGRDGVRREITVVCQAEDKSGNMSPVSSPAHLVLVDAITVPSPAQPPEPHWTSWPDANGDCRWTVRWQQPGGASAARVSTATETRLLALSGTARDAHLALSHAERAAQLKRLAIETPNAFAPEELAYPINIQKHDVVLPADSDDLRVVVVEFIGETGQKASWPDREEAFAVVRARSSSPAPSPLLTVKRDNAEDIISATSRVGGLIEVFVLTSPVQADLIDIITPAATLSEGAGPFRQDRTGGERWLGYTARLRAADGRVSALSPILWRENVRG